jgi:hypothetical protein
MFDNGAFSFYRSGKKLNTSAFYDWISPHLAHPHWAVIPDAIGGDVEQQRSMVATWPNSIPKDLGMPVWHLGLPLDYLLELADNWPRICFGSSGEFWEVGGDAWCNRMDEAFNALAKRNARLPWIHGLRMLGMSGMRWPLASADSTNVAQNHHLKGCPSCMADKIDAVQCPSQWIPHPTQMSFI